MSKSIKDYKDAVDNIKISDSFCKRTEALLSDLSEMEIEKKPIYGGGRITAFVMTAAACLACVIGVRVMTDSGQEELSAADTGITEIITSEISESVDLPLIDDFDGGDNGMLIDEDGANALPTELMEVSAVADDRDAGKTPAAAKEAENAPKPAGEPDGKPDGGQNIPTANSVTSPDADMQGVSNNAKGSGNTEPAAEAGTPTDNPSLDYADAGVSPELGVNDSGAEEIPSLRDTEAEVITVEITPYFNMDSIRSGEGAVKMNGAECRDIIDRIAEISENSREIGSYSFKSVFMIGISDENVGATYYSIYITDLNALIVNKHMAGGQQRVTYGVKDEDYNALMRRLFSLFGSDEDYELFDTLISGK